MEVYSFALFAVLLWIPVTLSHFPSTTYFKLKSVNLSACRLAVYWSVFQKVCSCPRKAVEKSSDSKVTEEGILWTLMCWLLSLPLTGSNVAPPSLCHKVATDSMLLIIEAHPNWPFSADIFEHPPPRLASQRPIWSDMTSVDTVTQWREDWSSASVLLPTLLSDSQVSVSLIIRGLWWTISGQVKAHVVLTCTNGVSPNHLPVIVASERPWTTLSTHAHQLNWGADWIYSTKRMMHSHMAGTTASAVLAK